LYWPSQKKATVLVGRRGLSGGPEVVREGVRAQWKGGKAPPRSHQGLSFPSASPTQVVLAKIKLKLRHYRARGKMWTGRRRVEVDHIGQRKARRWSSCSGLGHYTSCLALSH